MGLSLLPWKRLFQRVLLKKCSKLLENVICENVIFWLKCEISIQQYPPLQNFKMIGPKLKLHQFRPKNSLELVLGFSTPV